MLRISRAVRQEFPPATPAPRDAELDEFLTDLVGPYRIALDGAGSGHTYAGMSEHLVRAVGPPGGPVDLVAIAYAVPDTDPRHSPANLVNRLDPGNPLAFAVCDQGAAAAFSALSVLDGYARSGACRRALLLVLEHAGLPYRTPDLPARSTAVGLLLDGTGDTLVSAVAIHPDVEPDRVGAVLAPELARHGSAPVVLSEAASRYLPALAALTALPGRVTTAPAGLGGTAVWWELAGGLPGWVRAGRPVLLVEYEPELRYLCTLVIEAKPS